MYKMTAGIALMVFSQLSFGAYNFKCSTQDNSIKLDITNARIAQVKLLKNNKETELTGSFSYEQDFHYQVYSYQLIDKSGEKADLTVSTKVYMGRGGGCRTRVCNTNSLPYELTTAKLNYNSQETYLNCK